MMAWVFFFSNDKNALQTYLNVVFQIAFLKKLYDQKSISVVYIYIYHISYIAQFS